MAGQRNALGCVVSSSPRRGSGTVTGCKEVDDKRVKVQPFILLPTYGPIHHVSKRTHTKVHGILRNMAITANRVRERSLSLDIPNEIQRHIVGKIIDSGMPRDR
jgi:hypothetical protein